MPLNEQEPNESQRLWAKVTEGIKEKNMEKATQYKTEIEEAQREAARQRQTTGQAWQPRFFIVHGDRFIPNMSALPEMYCPPAAQQYFANELTKAT